MLPLMHSVGTSRRHREPKSPLGTSWLMRCASDATASTPPCVEGSGVVSRSGGASAVASSSTASVFDTVCVLDSAMVR